MLEDLKHQHKYGYIRSRHRKFIWILRTVAFAQIKKIADVETTIDKCEWCWCSISDCHVAGHLTPGNRDTGDTARKRNTI